MDSDAVSDDGYEEEDANEQRSPVSEDPMHENAADTD